MRELAMGILNNLESLAEEYDRRLRSVRGYADMPDVSRLEVAQNAMLLVAAGLEAEAPTLCVEFVQAIASRRVAQGYTIESVQQALTLLAEILSSRVPSLEMAELLWRTMVEVYVALFQVATNRLRTAEEQFRYLADSIPVGIFIHQDGILRYAGREGVRLLAYESPDELLGRSVFDLVHPDDREWVADIARSRVAGRPVPDQYEARLLRKDGSVIDAQICSALTEYEGRVATQGAFVDISEKKQLERQIRESLERRGRQVQTSAEVAQEIASAPALDELYEKVVTLVKERFGYYHTQLFLLSEKGDRLLTVAGYGEVGRQLVEQGHSMPMGKGVVGRAAARGCSLLSPDVSQDPEWLYQPLLPDTKGELSVPIILRQALDVRQAPPSGNGGRQEGELCERVLGVLDVQSMEVNALTDDDRISLEGLCGQIAIAIESTRLREDMEESLHELERLTHALSREGWEAFWHRAGSIGYLYEHNNIVRVDDFWAAEVGEAARGEVFVPPVAGSQPMAVAPLKVHGGQFIGVLGVLDSSEPPLSEEDLALIRSVAEQVARALENTRLFEETQRRFQEVSMLFHVSQALAGAPLQADEIASVIAHQFVAVMGIPAASVSLLEPDGDSLRILVDLYADPVEGEIRRGEEEEVFHLADYPATARVMETLQPLVVQAGDPDAGPTELVYMRKHGTVTLVIIPLVVKGKAIGIVELESPDNERHYLEEDLSLATTLANQAAVALENARLFEEAQLRLRELTMLFSVSQTLACAPLRASEIGEIVVRQFVEVMGISEASISLLNPEDGMMHVVADFFRADEAAVAGIDRLDTPNAFRLADYPATARVMETLQPLVVQASDPHADPAELAFMQKYGRKTLVILPLPVKGQSIGVLELESWDREYYFAPEQIDLAMTLAHQMAVTLENARLFEASQVALAEVEATQRSYLRRSWQEHLQQRKMLERSGFLYDQPQAEGAVDTGYPRGAMPAPTLWRPEMERAVVQGGPVAVQGGDGDEERAGLAVPITLRGQTLGVIGVESLAGGRQWTEDEIDLIEVVAEQLGQALETARLFADSQRRAERERLVGEITAKIRASTDVRAILETTAVELGQLLGTSRATVRLATGEPEDDGRPPTDDGLRTRQTLSVDDAGPSHGDEPSHLGAGSVSRPPGDGWRPADGQPEEG